MVERLGRFAGTLNAGFHILVPFVDTIRYRHSTVGRQSAPPRDQEHHATSGHLETSTRPRARNRSPSIKASEARRQQQINEAEGQAAAILSSADATAEGIQRIATAIQQPGGFQAVQLRVAEQYIEQFGNLAKVGNTFVVPSNLTDVASVIATAMSVIKPGEQK